MHAYKYSFLSKMLPSPNFCVHHYLLYGALSLEKNTPAQQLCEDAAYRPDIYRWSVMLASHQNLRSTVILRHHLLGHVTRRIRLLHSRQAKVTNLNEKEKWHISLCHYYLIEHIWCTHYLKQTVAVDQKVPWFDVSVQNACRMQVLQPCEKQREDIS